jgi:hypothetical protein
MSAEERIHGNINKYLEGMKRNKNRLPENIHLFEKDYNTLLDAENKRRKAQNPKNEKLDTLPDYRGIPVIKVCKK